MTISYNKEYLDLVKELSAINPSIIFDKNDDKVIIKRSDASRSIIYTLESPKENFDFESKDLAFYNFPEFHQLLSVFESPTLTEDKNKINISENKSKINYRTSDSEVIPKVNGSSKFGEGDVIFSLSESQLDKIKKMIGLIGAEKLKLKVTADSNEIVCQFFNLSHSNNWENSYVLDTQFDENFELVINSRVFSLLPRNDYIINIKQDGIVRMNYVSDDYKLELFIPEDTEANN